MTKLIAILLCSIINAAVLWILSMDIKFAITVSMGYLAGAVIWGEAIEIKIRAK